MLRPLIDSKNIITFDMIIHKHLLVFICIFIDDYFFWGF